MYGGTVKLLSTPEPPTTMTFSQLVTSSLLECDNLQGLNLEEGYPLVPVVSDNWKLATMRLLVVVETVDSLDLFNGHLLSGSSIDAPTKFREKGKRDPNGHNPMLSVLSNLLDKSVNLLKPYVSNGDVPQATLEDLKHCSFGCVNFSAKKSRHLPADEQRVLNAQFGERVVSIIDKLKPTHVLVSGDSAAYWMYHHYQPPVPDWWYYQRGWVHKFKAKHGEFLLGHTLDFELLYNPRLTDEDDDDDTADAYAAGDLLLFCARNIVNLFAGRHLHSIEHVGTKPYYVDTRKKFDRLMERLEEEDFFAVDTEARNLSSTQNAAYYLQFAFDSESGWVVPFEHPKSPFSESDQKYIRRRLKSFLGNPDNEHKVMVFHTGSFDLRLFRTRLDLKMVMLRVHDVPAGEQVLDENLGLFSRQFKANLNGTFTSTSYGGLAPMCMLYGNDTYYARLTFSKTERNTTGNFEPDDPDVLKYASSDVTLLYAIAKQQFKRAARTLVRPPDGSEPVPYSKFFKRHVWHQMSNTVQAISLMEESGSPIDLKYLDELRSPQSPLLKVVAEQLELIRSTPAGITTNEALLRESGKPTSGLFGAPVTVLSMDKREHVEELFLKQLGLEPVAFTGTGKPSIGKAFMAAYREQVPEVAFYETYVKGKKLVSAFVKGWLKKVKADLDSITEYALRPGFGFFTIVTGRLNSFGPSLQQVPSRGPLAKYIKRMFIAPYGYLGVKADYSSHEVRVWSIIAREMALAAAYIIGLNLRRELIACTDPKRTAELLAELKKKGDLHIANVFRFFGKWVDKSDPLREGVKAVVFGVNVIGAIVG